ncbi:MAG TPA: hypothetical protein VGM88_35485 [Kofleriaceae bacterium]|jgi:hypothetical protein
MRQYDPVDEIDYREYPDARAAVAGILQEVPPAHVYAIGEYHPTKPSMEPPLRRFTSDIIDQLAPHAKHLLVESWLDDGCTSSETVHMQVMRVTHRPPASAEAVESLFAASVGLRLTPHELQMTCLEHGSLLDAGGNVDFLRLLEMITEKLHDSAKNLSSEGVIVYGGALHNDLYPSWPLADLSYAHTLAGELGPGGVLELDLVSPEVVAPMAMVRAEPWFPLLSRAAPGRALVWRRAPDSYVVILPAQSLEPAKVAMVREPI